VADEELRDPVPLPLGDALLDIARPDDVDAIAEALTDPEIALWNPSSRRRGMSAKERARLWVAERSVWTSDHASWVVRDESGQLVGQVSLHQLDPFNRSGEMGYWLTPAGRGRGLGAAAVSAATRFGFDVLELARIELFHAVENEASCRLALRAGYQLEGTARQSFVYGDGQRHDEHLHARLATDPEPPVRATA
jgi:RimJ/RimL family protein N-acetyltransferase